MITTPLAFIHCHTSSSSDNINTTRITPLTSITKQYEPPKYSSGKSKQNKNENGWKSCVYVIRGRGCVTMYKCQRSGDHVVLLRVDRGVVRVVF
jgi:hypothetical protein